MNKYTLSIITLGLSSNAFAERGVSVDVHGFLDTLNENIITAGSTLVGGAVVLTALGLMIPGFREITKRSLPWTVMGVLGIVLVTKYFH